MNRFLMFLVATTLGCGALTPPASEPAREGGTSAAQAEEGPPITEADVQMPSDYTAAVERLRGYRDAVRQAVESGHYHDAHRPLDEMEIVINRLPYLARDSGVPKRYWEQVVVSGEDLSELFNRVHEAIDAHQTPNYAAVAEPIDAALARLAEVAIHDAKPAVGDSASEVQP